MKASESPKRTLLWFGVLVALYAVDFYFDVRDRDLFSWMDPYQYFEFAVGVVNGSEAFDRFEIPSIFPFFVMPFVAVSQTVTAALWVNVLSLLVLLYAVHLLARELELETPAPLVALLVLSSPMLIGLSRSLYSEFALSAWMALAFATWLRMLRLGDRRSGVAYGATFAVAFMIKLTLPVFMILPVAGALLACAHQRDFARARDLLVVAVLPIVIAVAIHIVVFAPSLGYYMTVASTSLPFMFLMGPVEALSWASATYYLREIAESFVFLLTPFLVLAAWRGWPTLRGQGIAGLASPRAAIWLWLLSPVVILVLHPLKEPRHVAASIVPAALLVVMGVESLSRGRARNLALGGALGLALVQYLAVTHGHLDVPYFMDRSMHYQDVRDRILTTDTREIYEGAPEAVGRHHWNFNQNIAIAGFPANEALALTWQAFPGVTFDLDTLDDPSGRFEEVPFEQFEDLFFLSGINVYNRRCGWNRYQRTLDRDVVIANADILILNDEGNFNILERFPDHRHFASVAREGGMIHLMKAKRPTQPYRVLYAREFLRRNPALEAREVKVVGVEILLSALLGWDTETERAVRLEFGLATDTPPPDRNIYWIGGYPDLIASVEDRQTD